jgi:hypothetical protein
MNHPKRTHHSDHTGNSARSPGTPLEPGWLGWLLDCPKRCDLRMAKLWVAQALAEKPSTADSGSC